MLKSVKQKAKGRLLRIMASHPKILTLGIRLAITLGIGTAIGLVDFNHLTYAVRPQCIACALLRTYIKPDIGEQHCIGC